MNRSRAILLTLLAVAAASYLGIHFARSLIGKTKNQSASNFDYPKNTVNKAEIRTLLQEKRFPELNQTLSAVQSSFEKDPRNEYICFDTFQSFHITNDAIESPLNEWVTKTPNAYSHLGFALYHYAKAWEGRGGKWANQTSKEQFSGMEDHFAIAQKNIAMALKENRKLLSAYWMLIQMAKADGDSTDVRAAFERGSKTIPRSLILRAAYMDALTPRWGGSYAEMQVFATRSRLNSSVNPAFAVLSGLIDLDKGQLLEDDQKNEEALRYYNHAFESGNYWLFYESRGRLYCRMERYHEGLADLTRALELRPQRMPTLIYHAGALAGNQQFEKALEEFQLAASTDPNDPELKGWKDWSAARIDRIAYQTFPKDHKKGLDLYNLAAKLQPAYAQTFAYRGYSFSQTGETDKAIADLKTAMQIDPHDITAYQYMKRILGKQSKWDEILPYWDQYIALEPNNALAYLERGGTYFRKGDLVDATADAKKACDLGNQEGCQHFKELSVK